MERDEDRKKELLQRPDKDRNFKEELNKSR
jgi:hypothetical protein